jgi:hypothetical protein
LIRTINNFFNRLLRIPYSSYLFIFVPFIIASIRIAEEELLYGFEGASAHLVLNYTVGYLLLHLMMTTAIRIGTDLDFRKTAGITSVGLVLAWLPPIIDLFLWEQTGRNYLYFSTFRWNFVSPEQMIGESITVWLVILGTVIFAAWATRSILRAILTGSLAYITLQILAWGWIYFSRTIIDEKKMGIFESSTMIGIILVFFLYILLNWKTTIPSLKRFNHAIPWGLISIIGSRLINEPWSTSIIKGIVMALAFQFIIFANDFFDRYQDESRGGVSRPVANDDMIFMTFLMVLLSLWMLIFHERGFFLLLLFFALCSAYHLPQLRFKRLFCLNYKIEGISAAIAFLIGVMRFSISGPLGTISVNTFPEGDWAALFSLLIMGGFSLGSMFKDYKDIDQDMADKVGTIYTRLLKKGKDLQSIHRFIKISTTLMFLIPPIWLVYMNRNIYLISLLFISTVAIGFSLHAIKNRKKAVEATILLINVYLIVLSFTVPVMIYF